MKEDEMDGHVAHVQDKSEQNFGQKTWREETTKIS